MIDYVIPSCGWIFPYTQVCVVCVKRRYPKGSRPTKLLLDDQGRLHAESEPAIEFTARDRSPLQ